MSLQLVTRSVWLNPGNRRKRALKVGAACLWQIWKRIVKRPLTIRLANRARFKAHPDCVVSSALIYADWPEYHELQFIRRQLQHQDVIVDVGANVGHISLLLSDIVDPQNIFAFEPTPISFRRLVENWEANGWPTTNLFQGAVGSSGGVVRVPDTASPETRNSIASANETATTVEVRLVSLDEYRSHWSGRRTGLLKIDVEEFEREVFAGAHHLLQHDRPRLIMFESLCGSVDKEIQAMLKNVGYSIFQLNQAGRPDFAHTSAQNLFAIPIEDTPALR